MKNFFFLTFLIIGLSCFKPDSKIDYNIPSEIYLHFEDFDPLIHKSFIDIKIENSIYPIEEQLKITDDGVASYNFINERKREVSLNYENRLFNLLISPNEKISISLSVEELMNRQSKLEVFEVTSGINMKTNNLILTYTPYVDSLTQSSSNPFQKTEGETLIQYKDKRLSEMKSQLTQFKTLCIQQNIQDEAFINWGHAQIHYKAGNDLAMYPFIGTINRAIDEDNEYFKFIEDIRSVDQNNLRYLVHIEYLSTLASSLAIVSNIANKYKEERNLLKQQSSSNSQIYYKVVKDVEERINTQDIYASAYHQIKDASDPYRDSFRLLITDKTLLPEEYSKQNESDHILTLLEKYDILEAEKQELINIYQELKGKVILQDFWFEGCSPCMKELPHYNDLMEYSSVENVAYLFFGAYMNENDWKRVIKEFGIKGKHHLLTKDQLAFFEKYFNLRSYPHRRLITEDGQIGQKLGLSVKPENFEKINDIIGSLQD